MMSSSSAKASDINPLQLLASKERIILVIDTHREMAAAWNEQRDRITALKEVLSIFIKRKLISALVLEIAVYSYDRSGRIHIVSPFTRSADTLISRINRNIVIEGRNSSEDTDNQFAYDSEDNNNNNDSISNAASGGDMDIGRVVEDIAWDIHSKQFCSKGKLVESSDGVLLPFSDCIVRFLLFYGRSYEIPAFDPSPRCSQLLCQPRIYLDMVYLHLKANNNGSDSSRPLQCQEVFDSLGSIYTILHEYAIDNDLAVLASSSSLSTSEDNTGIVTAEVEYQMKNNFLFESHNSDLKLQTIMTILLGHCVQRRSQAEMLQMIDVSS